MEFIKKMQNEKWQNEKYFFNEKQFFQYSIQRNETASFAEL